MTPRGQVVKAIAVIRRRCDGALLVSEERNPSGALFHRPLGGHVEFGDHALDTVQCEFREEIGQALTAVRPAGALENIFEWNGATQHEIVFVFTAAFADEAAYAITEQVIRDTGGKTRVIWRPPETASPPVYPAGVADLAPAGGRGNNGNSTNWFQRLASARGQNPRAVDTPALIKRRSS
jgi:ADP-ribose pyrophosphatase YjhB (NUDIX family)